MSFTKKILTNEIVHLTPLLPEHFEDLFMVASDPLIWEQHPNPDRYKREVFMNFFEGALASEGAYLILDAASNEIIGCSRYYDYNPEISELKVGYTFFSRKSWGKGYNKSTKKLMLDHAFNYIEKVVFHVGAQNLRSQKAMIKIGAKNIGEMDVAYYGETTRRNIIYVVEKGMCYC